MIRSGSHNGNIKIAATNKCLIANMGSRGVAIGDSAKAATAVKLIISPMRVAAVQSVHTLTSLAAKCRHRETFSSPGERALMT